MTINDLIIKLKEVEEKYGNIEVKIDHPNDFYMIRNIWVYDEGKSDEYYTPENPYVAIKI